jgi:hypothetical protein
MTPRETFGKIYEWLFRASAMNEARAVLLASDDVRGGAARQAKLLVEVARRVAEPVETLPNGSRSAVLLGLYREAVGWALYAGRPNGATSRPDLATLWNAEPPEHLLAAGKDPATVESVKAALVDAPAPAPLDASEEQASRARAFTEALVWELDAPQRRVDRVLGQRWIRVILAGIALIALVYGLRKLTLGPNLAADRPFRTSSSWSGCAADASCRGLLFHTDPENNPWAVVDLGAPKSIHRVEVTNRGDCCGERSVPLIVELSNDNVHWTEVAKREAEFSSWTAKFPRQTARYVKLRVPRQTVFHLEDVAVR